MRSLDTARQVCDRIHPGLLKGLSEVPAAVRESRDSPVVDVFRDGGGAGLLVPTAYGGAGADALDAVRVTRAIGSYSPSLGAAATMHNFTAAMLFELVQRVSRPTAEQDELLARVAPDGLLLASGWAEGMTQQDILNPAVRADAVPDGFLLNGAKKPCSLSRSMDFLTASVTVPGDDGRPALAIALVPAGAEGLSVHPFWSNEVLAASQSDEVRLRDVHVPDRLVIRPTPEDPGRLDDLQTAAFVWFELLITSAYVGAASRLVEHVLERQRGSVTDRARLAVQAESAVALSEGTARALRDGLAGDDGVGATLTARYAIQSSLTEISSLAIELLGGISFIRSPDEAYLSAALHPLSFHPPGRTSTSQGLVDYYNGDPLRI